MAIIRFFLAVIGCFLVLSCSKKEPPQVVAPTVPVEIATVELQTIPVNLDAIGTVEPLSIVQIKPKVGGEIISVDFADGAFVKTGDVLFRIDTSSYTVALKRAEANLAMAQSSASNANDQVNRYKTLIDKGVASKEQFSQLLSTDSAQKAQQTARQADVEEARLALDWAQVRSPIDGRAGAALVKRGNIVQAHSEVLVVVNQIKPIYVSFFISGKDLSEVLEQMKKQELQVEVLDENHEKTLGYGMLSFIDNTVDRTTSMVNMKARFSNEDEALWPGRFVNVNLTLREEKDVLLVPSAAIMEGQNGDQVFVVSENVATLRPVQVGRTYGAFTIIRSGLKAGETVVTSGQLRIQSGGQVSIKPSRSLPLTQPNASRP